MTNNIEKLVDELDDFDLTTALYQVWGFYLDKDQQVLTDILLQEFDDPDDAVAYVKTFISNLSACDLEKEGATYYEVVVETVVDFGNYTENIATLFRDVIEI